MMDTTPARLRTSGTSVYVLRLRRALEDIGLEVVEACNMQRRPPGGGGLRSLANAVDDTRWVQVELPRLARAAKAHVLHHTLPAFSRTAHCPQVVTVHDLAFERLPDAFDPSFRAHAHRTHRRAAREAAAVICPSETTARDVRALWGVHAERIVVARHGPGQELDGAARGGGGLHFLYVGDAEPRKNLGLLLGGYRSYREATEEPLPLVLAGAIPEELTRGAEGVWRVADPDPERLERLYAGALALVHPSLHEGFGLTLLEAMSAGIPVLAARSPGVVEICAEAARFFDPRSASELAGALAEMAIDAAARRDLVERGRRRAGEFSWPRSAHAHRAAYTLAAAS